MIKITNLFKLIELSIDQFKKDVNENKDFATSIFIKDQEKYISVLHNKDTQVLDFMSTDRHLLYILLHNMISYSTVGMTKFIFTEMTKWDESNKENTKDALVYTTYTGELIPNLKVYLYKDSTVDTFIPENMIDGSYQINFKLENT